MTDLDAPTTEAGRALLTGGREFISEAYPDGVRGNDGWSSEGYGAEGLTADETLSIYSMRLREAVIAIEDEARRALVAENKALREAHPGYHTNGWRTDCRDCALEDAGQFGHNLATYGGPSLGHSGEFADCPQKLCERVRAALHREDGA